MSLVILFHFLCAQHVSDINISIIRNLRLFCWNTTLVRLFLFRCVLEFRCGWVGVVSVLQASACNTASTWQHTTLTTHKQPCLGWNSNPHSQQSSGRRPLALDRASTWTGKWRRVNGILLLIIRNFWCFLYSNRFIKTAIWISWHIGKSCISVVDSVVVFSELPYCASCLIIERSSGCTMCKFVATLWFVQYVLYCIYYCLARLTRVLLTVTCQYDMTFNLLLPCLHRSHLLTIIWRDRRRVLAF